MLLIINTSLAQTTQQLASEISDYEQKIADLERQIAQNDASGNSNANVTLQVQKKSHEKEIERLLQQIKNGGGSANSNCESEIVSWRQQVEQREEIIAKIEKENSELQGEIQRLIIQGGGSSEIERLQKKVESQKGEIKVLKQQIQGYRQTSNATSSNTTSIKIIKLQGQIDLLEKQNKQLRQQSNTSSTFGNDSRHLFQRQFISENATSFVFGYKYSILPKLKFREAPKLYQDGEQAGTFVSLPNNQVTAHNGFLGFEWLWHGADVGFNLGLTANYSYNQQEDMLYHITGFQFSPELTILPLRIGLKPSVYAGYMWGQVTNHNALLNNSLLQANPKFNTFVWGWEGKMRVYISRLIAFTGTIGADYPIDGSLDMEFWGTSLKFGVGMDFIIPLKVR